jgi:hypothetical protein
MVDSLKAGATKRWVGEFFVIVTGVLVALAVDDFRSSREARAVERYYMDRLAEDLTADTAELADMLIDLDTLAVAAYRLSAHLDDPLVRPLPGELQGIDLAWDRVPRLHQKLGRLELSRATYQEIIASGDLRVLKSRELRRGLADYHLAIQRQAAEDAEWTSTLVDSWQLTLRDKGLLIIDLARDSTLTERMRGDPRALSIIRALGAGRGLTREARARLRDQAAALLSLIESL